MNVLTTVYFDNPGEENTLEALKAAKARAEKLGVKKIIVVSATGKTAVKAVEILNGFTIIAVGRCNGFTKPNIQDFTENNRQIVEKNGGIVLIATPVFGGLSKAMQKRFKNLALGGIVSNTLAIFGEGISEACEAVITCADCGLVRTDEIVISIAGTNGGADTAIVCNQSTLSTFGTSKSARLSVNHIFFKLCILIFIYWER